ncbi:MAG: Rrf2 family transcriptional regulator [Desulfuromonas sp.]|jgi:Rrf2 family iron-sulfur cluster assembly transcriptional regulator|nr:Rrf2 family transcriptional regulator [Desulfuromonas thiophila]MDD3802130.1 Rrf2 family transcriptional regulator [Desulfuromonas thiophila]
MRLSTKALYAVRAMVRLNLQQDGTPVSIREISDSEQISLTYLEQLFAKLRRSDLVQSVRGPGGGYVLARPADQIALVEIIDSVEETLAPAACVEGGKDCQMREFCVTHPVWLELGERIRAFLASISIEDLSRDAQRHGQMRLERSVPSAE